MQRFAAGCASRLAALFFLIIAAGCGTSGSAPDGGNAGGAGGGSGGGSAGGSSGGSAGGSSGGSGGGSSGDPTQLASGLSAPAALIVVGSQLFWIEDYGGLCNGQVNCTSTIKTVATTGGTPTAVVTKANLDPNLASDGTSLYFSTTTNNSTSAIFKCGLDGSNITTIVSGMFQTQKNGEVVNSALFVNNGTVYVLAQATGTTFINAVSPSGVVTLASPPAPSAFSVILIDSFFGVDSANLYFEQIIGPADVISIADSTHAGANDTALVAESSSNSVLAAVAVGGTVYVLSKTESTGVALVQTVSAAGSGLATFATFSATGNQLAADANGVYVDEGSGNHNPGIYSVSGGTVSLFVAVGDSSQRNLVLDSKNVYWFSGLEGAVAPGGLAFLHAKAR